MNLATTSLATIDRRRFFDRALSHGVQQGLISAERLDIIQADLAKGIVQLANYFGTAYLRPDLELAMIRISNLISLYLEDYSSGDVNVGAQSLQKNTLLSHSKNGADMLRRLHAMPHDTLLIQPQLASSEEQLCFLNEMSAAESISWSQYQADIARGVAIKNKIELGFWLAKEMRLAADEICDAEQLINSVLLLIIAPDAKLKLPNRKEFDLLIKTLKNKKTTLNAARFDLFFSEAPSSIQSTAQAELDQFIRQEWPKIRNSTFNLESFFIEGGIQAISDFDAAIAEQWQRISHNDDNAVIATIFLLAAAELPIKSSLLKREATALTQKIRDQGLNSAAVVEFIENNVPVELREELNDFWENDLKEEAETALADKDPEFPDAFMERAFKYLQKTCNTTWKGRS